MLRERNINHNRRKIKSFLATYCVYENDRKKKARRREKIVIIFIGYIESDISKEMLPIIK